MISLYAKRRFINGFNLTMSLAAMLFGLFWLGWILITLFNAGIDAISPAMFSQITPPPGEDGGLLNAIAGSLMMTTVATLIGTPIGILAGIYLAEFGGRGWLAPATRFINDILLSAPSIVIGLFIYAIYVAKVGHFAGWGGALLITVAVLGLNILARILFRQKTIL
jgi:phosphate transport system permease protein